MEETFYISFAQRMWGLSLGTTTAQVEEFLKDEIRKGRNLEEIKSILLSSKDVVFALNTELISKEVGIRKLEEYWERASFKSCQTTKQLVAFIEEFGDGQFFDQALGMLLDKKPSLTEINRVRKVNPNEQRIKDYFEELAFEQATTVESINEFISNYPGTKNIDELDRRFYFKAHSKKEYLAYLELFDKGKFRQDVENKLSMLDRTEAESPFTRVSNRNSEPVKIFISYSSADREYCELLVKQLTPMEFKDEIKVWSDADIQPGHTWENEIKNALEEVKVILFLVSPDFLASRYVSEVEINKAVERANAGELTIVPIIIRPCAWEDTRLSRYQVLPKAGKAISSWENSDSAFLDVLRSLKKLIKSYR